MGQKMSQPSDAVAKKKKKVFVFIPEYISRYVICQNVSVTAQ